MAGASPDRSKGDIQAMDLDKMMSSLLPASGKGSATHAPPTGKRKVEAKDCLATDSQGNMAIPTFTTKVPKKTERGFTMGGKASSKRYLGPGFVPLQSQSPGPIYNTKSFTDTKNMSQSFPRAQRLKDSGPGKGVPGPKYELSSTLGTQVTRATSPTFKMSQAERFKDKEYISAAHSKSAPPPAGDQQPGPASYQVNVVSTDPSGPAYSFGVEGATRARFNSKIFISRAHAKASGFGSHSPGPQPALNKHTKYGHNPELSSKCRRAPQYSFAGAPFGLAHDNDRSSAGGDGRSSPTHDCGKDSPGPGVYNPEISLVKEKAPAFSFGVHVNNNKLFLSAAHSADAKGRVSPGPMYNPDPSAVLPTAPAFSFADADPEMAAWKSRFTRNRYIGAGIGIPAGEASPGPAEYSPRSTLPSGPAYTMARREKTLMKRICPAPERARYISKDLARENLGCYSPGPKYALPSTIGGTNGTSYTFGSSNRHFSDIHPEVQEKLGTSDKPYTSPAEAMFISKQHANANQGRFSPGPKYKPETRVTRVIEVGDQHDGKTYTYTQDVNSRHHTAPSITMGTRSKGKVTVDTRQYYPDDKITRHTSPGFSFGSASRSGVGPLEREREQTNQSRRGTDNQEKRHIESSPGPGAFKPNYASIHRHIPGATIGGLSTVHSPEPDRDMAMSRRKRPPAVPASA